MPGPRIPLKLAGVPITRVIYWVPQAGRLGLGLSVISYAGSVTFGVLADAAVLERPEALATDLEHEIEALARAVASDERSEHLSPADARAAWLAKMEPI